MDKPKVYQEYDFLMNIHVGSAASLLYIFSLQ